MTPEQLHVLQHSLGLDQYGQGTKYRNRFFTGPGSTDFPVCQQLVAEGYMTDLGPQELAANDHLFTVTPRGIDAVQRESQPPPKLTRGQRTYRRYLDADSGMAFKEWLNAQKKG